ncbi:hypothetical protein VRB37_10755 [Erwinia billingiae]|uniref:hypothetical protein n=1 Tax=Erwinia billingiae TaxID=182337 RepID=UPI0030D285CF
MQTIEQLKAIILSIFAAPEQINQKANAAIARIRNEHDILAYQQQLQRLYNR